MKECFHTDTLTCPSCTTQNWTPILFTAHETDFLRAEVTRLTQERDTAMANAMSPQFAYELDFHKTQFDCISLERDSLKTQLADERIRNTILRKKLDSAIDNAINFMADCIPDATCRCEPEENFLCWPCRQTIAIDALESAWLGTEVKP